MRRIRGLVLLMALISAPIAIVTYGWMFQQVALVMPWWLAAPTIISHLIAVIGVCSLFDSRQERQQTQEHGRRARHQRS